MSPSRVFDIVKQRIGPAFDWRAGRALMCALLTLPAPALSAAVVGGAPPAPIRTDSADAARTPSTRTLDRNSRRAHTPPGAGFAGRNAVPSPQRGRPKAAGYGDRVRALPSSQARGLLGRQPGSAIALNGRAGPVSHIVSPVPKATTVTRNVSIGSPRIHNMGRLGDTVIGRNNHAAVVDGTQLRHKF